MSDEPKKASTTHPLVQIAGCCAGSSVGIVAIVFALIALGRMQLDNGAVWAVAAMAAAPCAMGFGIAYFMCKQPRQDAPSIKP